MKILFILPVFAVVLYAFAKPDYKYNYADESSGDKMASVSQLQHEVKGKVVDQDGFPLPGTSVTVRGTTLGVSSDVKGSFKLDNIPEDGILIFSFVGFKTKAIKPVFTSEMTVNMIKDTLKYLNLNISTPPPPPPPPPINGNKNGSNVAPPPPPPPAESGIQSEDGKKPLVVIDGNISDRDAEKIDPETIFTMNVLKDKSPTEKPATDKYGEKGKDGVIEITTKEKIGKLLVIIDGVVNEKDGMSKIKMEDIKSMSVLKNENAVAKYGEKGRNGAIELTIFKEGEKRPEADKNAFVVVEEMPEFKGGSDAMASWIVSNLKYPAEAVNAKITGKVYVNFIVSSTGKVKNVVISKSVSPLLSAEAIRVISSMPDWKPGMQAGKNVPVQMQVPVEFKLN